MNRKVRQILSLALCLVLVLALLPRTAFAAERYGIWVSSREIDSDNMKDVLGDGKVSYEPSTKTLTILAGANIKNPYGGALIYTYITSLNINAPQGLTLNVPSAENGILMSGSGVKLTINGNTTISTNGVCIDAPGNVTINGNATLNSANSSGASVYGFTVDGTLNVKAAKYGIRAYNDVSISKDVMIQSSNTSDNCIYSSSGTVKIQSGVWTLDGNGNIYARSISMLNHEVTEPVGGQKVERYGSAYIVDANGSIPKHVVISPKSEATHTCPGAAFKDMPAFSNWAHTGIDYVISKGLMSGTSATTFEPKTAMSRAMLVTVLYRMSGQPGAGATKFSDVPSGKWYSAAVSWAADKGIVSGVGGGKFDPDGNVTREQIATILFRYTASKGYSTSERASLAGFTDASKVGTWFIDGMKWAVARGLISGTAQNGKTYLNPQGAATREQVASILMRLCDNVIK